MLGRDTPSPQLDSAAEYIAARFREYGLEPVRGSNFHTYVIKRSFRGDSNALTIDGTAFAIDSNFVPYEFGATGRAEGRAVFVGYGISLPEAGYDDYAGLDVRGKVAVVIGGRPIGAHVRSVRDERKMRYAAEHGAVGIVFIGRTDGILPMRPVGALSHGLMPRRTALLPFNLVRAENGPAIPAVGVDPRAAEAILGMPIDSLQRIIVTIDSTGRPASRPLSAAVSMDVRSVVERVPVRNVVGMVRGTTMPDEYVVIGAHYDHIGHGRRGNSAAADTIYNGADDNASGTTAVLLAAKALGGLRSSERPKRSILFITFSGEEKGLFGSRAWVADPLLPNEKCVAMLNMDMVGRNAGDSVLVGGRSVSTDMLDIVEVANRAEPMKIGYTIEQFMFRSDQASFAQERIPVVFLSGGLHKDYHRASDEPARINLKKVARIARLVCRAAWQVAQSETRPAYIGTPFPTSSGD